MADSIQVHPAPTPMQWIIDTAQAPDGTKMVVLQFFTPQGNTVLFFDLNAIRIFIDQLAEARVRAKVPGIVVATDMPPEDPRHNGKR